MCCRKPERCGDVSSWASTTIDMLRRKIQNLEDENVSLKVGTCSSRLFLQSFISLTYIHIIFFQCDCGLSNDCSAVQHVILSDRSFSAAGSHVWNALPSYLRWNELQTFCEVTERTCLGCIDHGTLWWIVFMSSLLTYLSRFVYIVYIQRQRQSSCPMRRRA